MKKILLLSSLLLLLAMVTVPVPAADGGPGWLPAWAGQLGLTLEKVPTPQESFVQLTAKVESVEKISAFLPGVTAGDQILIKHNGNVDWSIDIEGTSVKPCLVRITDQKTQKTVNLIPDRRTGVLRLAPPPFRGSNLQ